MLQLSLNLKFGAEDSPAKTYHLPERVDAMDLMEQEVDSSIPLPSFLANLAPELSCSKTSQVSYLPTEEPISKSLFKRWPSAGMLLDGACLTANISESPNHAVESTLLDILEEQAVPPRYYLSPNAAKGSLRRASSQGRKLFPPLKKAFETLAQELSSNE